MGWKSEQEAAFKNAKELIKSPTVLAHYDGTQTLVLTCDASLIGQLLRIVLKKEQNDLLRSRQKHSHQQKKKY